MLRRLHPLVLFVGAVLLGALGWLATAAVAHVVADHARLHQIWDLEIRRAQQAQQPPALPVPPPAAGGS